MSTWAVVPVKGFDHGKSRLAPALAPNARRALALALFRRVLRACTACTAIDQVLVASDSARVITPSARVSVLLDAAADVPFARTLDAALAHAHARGATRAVIAMGDLPLIRSIDLAELAFALDTAQLVVAPDESRRGVGAIGCRLPAPIPMQLGHRDSFDRTMRAARRHEAKVALVHNPRIARDLDTSADLNALLRLGSGLGEPALGALLRA
jgi:2-phospho-L-lactate guanylyltransferase